MRLRWASNDAMLAALEAVRSGASIPASEIGLHIDGIEDHEHPHVLALRGIERLNQLYRFDVIFTMSGAHRRDEELRARFLGRHGHLSLTTPDGGHRVVHGVCGRVQLLELYNDRALYHVQLVPKLWLATKTTDSRVFQDLTVREILAEVLNEHGIAHVFSLARRYTRRRYCIQHEETDYAFVRRLLAEEGIFYGFEHPPDHDALRELLAQALPGAVAHEAVGLAQAGSPDAGDVLAAGQRLAQPEALLQAFELSGPSEVMVLADSPSAYHPLPGLDALNYRPDLLGGAMELREQHIHDFAVSSAIEPTRATARDYDPERAQRIHAGHVIGTVPEGMTGALADAASALVEEGSSAMEEALRHAGGGLADGLGAVGTALGIDSSQPLTGLGQVNASVDHGVLTATHGILPLTDALARSAVGVAGAALGQAVGEGVAGELIEGVAHTVQHSIGGHEAHLEVYEHHGEYEEPEATLAMVRSRLQQLRAEHVVAAAHTHCRRLVPGHTFALQGHPADSFNRDYALIEVVHEALMAEGSALYTNRLQCVPASVPFRPPRPPRRVHQAVESAVVVGPEHSDIVPNEHGSVKVQFHWDRKGKHDQRSSCWIRVMQPWAGPQYGFQFIPRVGMEVLVSFVGGDINRPVVIGCMPNLANQPPHHLPQDKTRSGIRTKSSPGGNGHNELMFDDKQGQELVYLRAQHNHHEQVVHDQQVDVGHDQNVSVEHDRTDEVAHNRTSTVGGNAIERISGNSLFQVQQAASHRVGSDYEHTVGGNESMTVSGSRTLTVGGFHQLLVGGEGQGYAQVGVSGRYRVGASGAVTISSSDSIHLSVGSSQLTIDAEGITLSGNRIHIEGEEQIVSEVEDAEIRIDSNVALVGEELTAHSSGARLKLTDMARLDGDRVLLNCGDGGPSQVSRDDSSDSGEAMFDIDAEGVGPVTLLFQSPEGDIIERQIEGREQVTLEGRPGERFTLIGARTGDGMVSVLPPQDSGEEQGQEQQDGEEGD